jgi:hypothetical protein
MLTEKYLTLDLGAIIKKTELIGIKITCKRINNIMMNGFCFEIFLTPVYHCSINFCWQFECATN